MISLWTAGCKVCIGQRWTDNLHWQPGQAQSKGCQVVRGNITSQIIKIIWPMLFKVPLITVHDQPYLISVLSKSIEIRTDEPSVLIQTVELPRPRLATRAAQGRVYIAAQGLVRLLPCHIGSNLIQPLRCGCWPWCLWLNKSLNCSGTSSLNWLASPFNNGKLIFYPGCDCGKYLW